MSRHTKNVQPDFTRRCHVSPYHTIYQQIPTEWKREGIGIGLFLCLAVGINRYLSHKFQFFSPARRCKHETELTETAKKKSPIGTGTWEKTTKRWMPDVLFTKASAWPHQLFFQTTCQTYIKKRIIKSRAANASVTPYIKCLHRPRWMPASSAVNACTVCGECLHCVS